jgi:hypothetical protein
MDKPQVPTKSLALPATAGAYGVVLSDLRSRLATADTAAARAVLEQALTALEKVPGPAAPKPAPATGGRSNTGNPEPGSAAEVEAELAMEKLDP